MNKENISILCGGISTEHDVSIESAKSILKHINKEKYTPFIFYISPNKKALLYKAKNKIKIPTEDSMKDFFTEVIKLKNMRMNINALHGKFGEDGMLQSILEFLNIPFTGSKSNASALCMDKYRSGLVVKQIKEIKIPKTKLLPLGSITKEYKYKKENICIKPNKGGSSIGTIFIRNQKEFKYSLNFLINQFPNNEDFIIQPIIKNNIEISCGCLQKKNGTFIKLPPIEIIPKNSQFFDYKSKYTKNSCNEITPPLHISQQLSNKISKVTIQIHKILGCSVYSRSDFLVKNHYIYYLETNTLPGMTDNSLLPKEAQEKGINFTELINFIIKNS